MIERTQKQILFEEAAKKGIIGSQLLQVPEIYDHMLGVSDIGDRVYGAPLAPIYNAKSGELIDVQKMANFFTGLSRDVRVADIALSSIENDLVLFNLEIWSRMQLLKNRAMDLSKKARVEKLKVSLGATWVYTETFSTTKNLDMENTTSWIDTAEGIAYLPNSGNEQTVPMQEITVLESTTPPAGDFLGSDPKHAFDGLDTTNWRCLFVTNEWASTIVELFSPTDLTAITIDPVGFGIELKVEAYDGTAYKEAVKAIIYNKKTFPIDFKKSKKLRVSFRSATAVLPKTVGIREVVLYQTSSSRYSEVISKLLKPTDPFTEIKINTKGEIPDTSKISAYFRTSTGAVWTKIETGDWHPITNTDTAVLGVDMLNATAGNSLQSFKGLYAISVPSTQIPLTTYEGQMNIGVNMAEVVAFRKDWLEDGDLPHKLTLTDFNGKQSTKTWSRILERTYENATQGLIVQGNGESHLSSDSSLTKGGDALLFQRRLDPDEYSTDISEYKQLCIVPLVGNSSENSMQYGYNYKISFYVHCPKQFSFTGAKYWFYQGYRNVNRRAYKDIGKSYGTFSIYINDILIVGDDLPNTVFSDNSVDGGDTGKGFSMNFNEGWNKVSILMNTVDPAYYGEDNFDVANSPYLQLSIYPSLFDPSFKEKTNHFISDLVASYIQKPVNEFDLLWNLPKDPIFWSWSQDRNYILFNTNQLKLIDGYFKGSSPASEIFYRSISSTSVDDLYIKLILEREDSTKLSPILDEYSVMVR